MEIVPNSPRILGLGWALFVALFLGLLLLLSYCLTLNRKHPLQVTAFILYITMILTIALFPKINVGAEWPSTPEITDGSWYWKISFTILMSLGGLTAIICGLFYYTFTPVFAQSIQ
jgi:hypothetical protein